ncbi:MAG: 23S rRNA (guanosine(2251)-2'-O)-methyltransferase RlmB [Clostridiales bacterium]|nr:23S rRNA (guanosine(2251)-2'-O)-methyltransferase RlmB [Clostridiales bacterium]
MEDIIFGKNAVKEVLKEDVEINKMLLQKEGNISGLGELIRLAKAKKIVIQDVNKKKLDEISEGGNHQGVIVLVSPFKYKSVEELIKGKESPLLVILDGIQDPHNLGAIIRTSYAAGVDGIIIPKRRAVAVNSTVVKTSTGYAMHMPIARVTNIAKTIDFLKKNNIWIAGTDMGGDSSLFNVDFKGGLGIVMGNEGEGISRLVKEKCDFIVSIPMKNNVESLNASVAASLLIYEAYRQRG